MKYVENWDMIQKRFQAWWDHKCIDRPMMRLVAKRDNPLAPEEPVPVPADYESIRIGTAGVEHMAAILRNQCRTHKFMAEAYPQVIHNIGPGPICTYLGGAEPDFAPTTCWYTHKVESFENFHLKYNPDSIWLKKHLDTLQKAVALWGEDIIVNVPDLVENVDILSAMRGPQDFCFDLIDYPEVITERLEELLPLYFRYYDMIASIVRHKNGTIGFANFDIIGKGRVAKVQCDFAALMSPNQFEQFVMPTMRQHCKQLDYSLYHLDGVGAIHSLDMLMDIPELTALQFCPGAGKSPDASPEWDFIHDKVKKAGKSIWLSMGGHSGFDEMFRACNRIVDRYGANGLYLLLPVLTEKQADMVLNHAETHWKP